MNNCYVSGIRPSGKIHLGNYLGAIKPWIELQKDPNDYHVFFVADMHVAGDNYSREEFTNFRQELKDIGLEKVVVESYYEADILSLQHKLMQKVPTGWLNRMTQFKDKTDSGDAATLALYAYPVLMAADIFYFGYAYNKVIVPVGEDQLQHVNFIRDLQAYFPEYPKPEAKVIGIGRVMDLQDGTRKMSKSSKSDKGIIYLSDTRDAIASKIKSAVTSTYVGQTTPETSNLLAIYAALGGKEGFNTWKEFKDILIELICKEFGK